MSSAASSSSASSAIVFHPAPGGNIAKYHLAQSAAKVAEMPRLIVVLDVSGSMGQTVQRIVQQELPIFVATMGYKPDDMITIIAFETGTKTYEIRVRELPVLPLGALGGTYMTAAVIALEHALLRSIQEQVQAVRLITLTDGEVMDQPLALARANAMRRRLEGTYTFNSQAVRTITSRHGQPDTQALTGMMQLSQMPSQLIDVNMMDYQKGALANSMVPLFIEDGLESGSAMLEATEPVLMTSPWKPATTKIRIVPGENVFWIKSGADDGVVFTIAGERIPLSRDASALDDQLVQQLLRSKIDQSSVQISVLKVNGTPAAMAEIRQILDYWTQLDQNMVRDGFDMNAILASDTTLATRLRTMRTYRERAERSFVARMSEIANDDRVGQLNAAQSADYLRSVSSGSNAKAMARRMVGNGVDTLSVMRREFLAVRNNIQELADIDSATHNQSFYSLATTMDGLTEIAQLGEDEIAQLTQDDCLRSFNMVGLAADGPVGEFPDPMCYQLNALYSGTYVSLSDVLTAASIGGDLHVPGQQGKKITNVIPVFDDVRIHQFMRKHMPHTLQIVASVGMRRVAGEIGMTYGYTLAAGIVQLVHVISHIEGRTEGNCRAFHNLVRDFRTAVGGYFNHIAPQLLDPVPDMSYWIGRNGLTNMIIPILELQAAGRQAVIAPVLRALYTFEIWQATRRLYRRAEDPAAKADELLNELMSCDIEEIKVPMTPLFDANPVPVFHMDYEINMVKLMEHSKRCWFVNYVAMFPLLLEASRLGEAECIAQIRGLPDMTDELLEQQLDIDYPMADFSFHNLVQALTVRTSEDRFDVDARLTKPALVDLRDLEVAEKMCRGVVRRYVEQRYSRDLAAKSKLEVAELTQVFVHALLNSSAVAAKLLIQEGITRGNCQVKMITQSSLAYQMLRPQLLDPQRNVYARCAIIRMLVLGKDGDEVVWNAGNGLGQTGPQMREFYEAWLIDGSNDTWVVVSDAYKANRRHLYRELVNRHGHNNANPSYFGYGYQSLLEMVDNISLEAWEVYKREHATCCGMDVMRDVMTVRIQKRLA